MNVELLTCGYSIHLQPFRTTAQTHLSHYLFRLQTEGAASALVEGRMISIESGDLLLYKPGDAYELQIKEEVEGAGVKSGDYYIFCCGDWIRNWWERRPRAVLTRVELHEDLLTLWKQLVMERRRLNEIRSELCGFLLQALCIALDRAMTSSPGPVQSVSVSKIKRFIETQAGNEFRVEDAARHVQLSASRAAHLFKEAYGESIMQYALKVRLAMVIDRMKYTTLTIEQISQTCGLGSYPYFHRVFKEQFGCSPRDYRSEWMRREG